MKTTVDITDALFTKTREYASSRNLSFRQVVEAGLRKVLEEGQHDRKPFRLRDGSFAGKGLAVNSDWPTIREMIYEGRGE